LNSPRQFVITGGRERNTFLLKAALPWHGSDYFHDLQ